MEVINAPDSNLCFCPCRSFGTSLARAYFWTMGWTKKDEETKENSYGSTVPIDMGQGK